MSNSKPVNFRNKEKVDIGNLIASIIEIYHRLKTLKTDNYKNMNQWHHSLVKFKELYNPQEILDKSSLLVDLTCQLSGERLINPVKCKNCNQVESMEFKILLEYLEKSKNKPWKCPLCLSDIEDIYNDLVIDTILIDILSLVSSSSPENAKSTMVLLNRETIKINDYFKPKNRDLGRSSQKINLYLYLNSLNALKRIEFTFHEKLSSRFSLFTCFTREENFNNESYKPSIPNYVFYLLDLREYIDKSKGDEISLNKNGQIELETMFDILKNMISTTKIVICSILSHKVSIEGSELLWQNLLNETQKKLIKIQETISCNSDIKQTKSIINQMSKQDDAKSTFLYTIIPEDTDDFYFTDLVVEDIILELTKE